MRREEFLPPLLGRCRRLAGSDSRGTAGWSAALWEAERAVGGRADAQPANELRTWVELGADAALLGPQRDRAVLSATFRGSEALEATLKKV